MASSTRARRFPLRLPLRFRVGVGEPWHRARTLDISQTGLSFTARCRLRLGSRLHMRFILRLSSACSEVACQGRIVRLRRAQQNSGHVTYTATIESYRFIRLRARRKSLQRYNEPLTQHASSGTVA